MKRGYLLVFSTAVISGLAIFINRFGVAMVNPYIFTWLKNLLVALLLTGLLLAFKDRSVLKKIKRKQWLVLLAIGLLGGSIPFLLFFKGLSMTSAAQGSFWHKTMFVYVAVLALIFLKEKINKKFIIGGLLLILANLVLLKRLPSSLGLGDILILSATLFWAVENVISKHLLKELPVRIVAWARMFFGALFIFVFLLVSGQLVLLSGLNFNQIGWVLLTSVFLFGYVMTWYSGLKHVPVSKAAVILLLGSPITTLLSFIWTGQITWQTGLAGFLIVVGIISIFGLRKTWQLVRGNKDYVRT